MKELKQKVEKIIRTPLGMVSLFILIFYVMTFLVYHLYGPGPVERLTSSLSLIT